MATAFTGLACGSDDETPAPVPVAVSSGTYTLDFKGYAVHDITLYKGPSGSLMIAGESYIGNYWTLYGKPAWHRAELNLKDMSLHLKTDAAGVKYPVFMKQDSVFIQENNGTGFLGIFSRNTSTLEIRRTFRYIKKVPADGQQTVFISKSTGFGVLRYPSVFPSAAFSSPADMKKDEDEVFWANVTYFYRVH